MHRNSGIGRGATACAVAALLLVLAAQLIIAVRQQSLTWDEDDHIFAGYMSWKHAEFGLNPEHPPLVKLLATLPLLPLHLREPVLQNRFFKAEAYLSGRDFLFGNEPGYSADTLVFRARMAAATLTILLALLVYFATREMFGGGPALLALLLLVFEPNIVAHGAYVTTDIGVSCFLFATVYAFYRYVKAPSAARLLITGLAGGLALSAKHSAILILPIVILLAIGVLFLTRETPALAAPNLPARTRKLTLAIAGMSVIAIAVLWSFYGFRYNMRPAGLAPNPTLAVYTLPLRPIEARGVLALARWHLLPESWLYGLTDVRAMANGMQSYIFGKVYEHGVWFYFPAVFVIKSTLGFLGLFALAIYAIVARKLKSPLEVLFLTVPPVFYLLVAMGSSLNIGARHILPLYVFFCVLAAGGAFALIRSNAAWRYVIALLVLFHVVSAARAFPNSLAYSNELWGGPSQTYRYLTDSNTDWGQQLKAVKLYLDQQDIHQCWFGYFVQPFVRMADYGIPCKPLPTADTLSAEEEYEVPPVIEGTVLVSAGDLSGFEFGSNILSPYRVFQKLQPTAYIGGGVFVFNGTFQVPLAAALVHVQRSQKLLAANQPEEALAEAQTGATIAPDALQTQIALGDAALAAHHAGEAREAYQRALGITHTMEPSAQEIWIPTVQKKLAAAS